MVEVWSQRLELWKKSPHSDAEVQIHAEVLRMKAEETKADCGRSVAHEG